MSERLQRERAFYDRCNSEMAEYGAARYYAAARAAMAFFRGELTRGLHGKRVLEIGCGPGSCSFYLGRRGGDITAIDISQAAIENAREKADCEGLANLTFEVMNAEDLRFDDATFDLVCGTAILHHLDVRKTYAGLARVLKPEGRACFIEPLAHNPLINLYRKLTPGLRTVDEHPLRTSDLSVARRCFARIDTRFFSLFTLLAVPFRKLRFFPAVLAGLEALDRATFAVLPWLRPWAWTCVMTLAGPANRCHLPPVGQAFSPILAAAGC